MRRIRDIALGGALLALVVLLVACPRPAEEAAAPADKAGRTAEDPITPAEYEVFAALFSASEPGGLDSPQFFEAVLNGRLVAGPTLAIEKPPEAGWPGPDFGPLGPGLVEDFKAKNQKPWPIADRIAVQYMKVISAEELEARLKALAESPETNPLGLGGDYVSLSRVGFSSAGDQALLRAAFTTPRAMGAEYLVLMKKTGTAWRLERVVMENLWYH